MERTKFFSPIVQDHRKEKIESNFFGHKTDGRQTERRKSFDDLRVGERISEAFTEAVRSSDESHFGLFGIEKRDPNKKVVQRDRKRDTKQRV
mmetsp:Transcript_3564/g.5317  ORF Transcript_3564/g.5317 Transcript_3564/m.5317 type:complete len:92 (+) Transcript_3564:600-875(+)